MAVDSDVFVRVDLQPNLQGFGGGIFEFLISKVLRKALNLKEVPDYTTICKAVKRLREEDLRKLLEESSKLLSVKLEVLRLIWFLS